MSFFKDYSDEALIQVIRLLNDEDAHEELFMRYCGPDRGKLMNRAVPGITIRFNLWDLSGVAFRVYYKCLDTFDLDQGGSFCAYFLVCLRHALYRFRDKMFKESDNVLSLDDELVDNGSGFCLHDVIYTKNIFDSPSLSFEFNEFGERVSGLLENMEDDVKIVGELRNQGLTYSEISKQTGLSVRQVYLRYQKYLNTIKDGINDSECK